MASQKRIQNKSTHLSIFYYHNEFFTIHFLISYCHIIFLLKSPNKCGQVILYTSKRISMFQSKFWPNDEHNEGGELFIVLVNQKHIYKIKTMISNIRKASFIHSQCLMSKNSILSTR